MKRQEKNCGPLPTQFPPRKCLSCQQSADGQMNRTTDYREYIDWLWPLSGVHSFSHDGIFGSAWVRVVGLCPPLSLPLDSSYVASLRPLPSKTSERILPVLSLIAPPFLSMSRTFSAFWNKQKRFVASFENDAGLVINGTGEGRDERQTNEEEKRKR